MLYFGTMLINRFYFQGVFILFLTFCLKSQRLQSDKHYHISAIGFWNVENLYDTLNDKWKNDEDFTPEGVNAWNGKRYWVKIDRLAETIQGMAADATPEGLAILGLCEVENKEVVADIVRHEKLKSRNYQVVLIEGPDARGVDPALIYNPRFFICQRAVSYPVKLVTDSNHKTRDILVVSGLFLGEPLAVLVNHWPSRRGGEISSRPNRNAAARVAKRIADSISISIPDSKIIVMGDLNDDPTNECVKKHIGTFASIRDAKPGLFFNPMEDLYKKGIGTLAWQDTWSLFDQILLNQKWICDRDLNTWQFYKAKVHNKDFLKGDFGNFKGYPFRTYSGGTYTGGYSDHFPSYIIIVKEVR
jgi:hypothetical protein